jgi:hypothetical protein
MAEALGGGFGRFHLRIGSDRPGRWFFHTPALIQHAATGGWGFGHFNSDGKTVDDAFMKTCFPCHQKMKERDLVFTRYSP